MATKLDKLLNYISCEKTIYNTYSRANEAINTFEHKTACPQKWNEFRTCIAEFMKHLDYHLLNMKYKPDISVPDYWAMSVRPLLKIYGINGEKAAFEIARTGNEGGLYGVYKSLAMHMAEHYARNEISAKVGMFLDTLTAEEFIAVGEQYIAQYGHIIPSEMTEGNASRIRMNLAKVLKEHPFVIQKIRQSGKKYG